MTKTLEGQSIVRCDGSVAVIVINYNGGTRILECIGSLERQTYSNKHIVVVDNQSTDGSLDLVHNQFPDVTIIENGYNAGWGVACNVGIQATNSEYVALINNDAYLDESCLTEMVYAVQLNDVYGSVASKILFWDDPNILDGAGLVIFQDGLSVMQGRLQAANRYDRIQEVFCANDCCCLYRREMLNEIGLYDPDFFIYADETDMGWRHQLAGWRCIYTPDAIAYHAHSKAAGNYSDLKAYYVERNRIYICFKYFPFHRLLSSFFFAAYRYLLQVGISQTGHGSLAKYRQRASLWRGVRMLIKIHLDALKMMPVMLRRRREYRTIRRLSIREIDDLFTKFGISAKEIAYYE